MMVIEGTLCPVCKGSGHDKGGQPVIKFAPYFDKDEDKVKRKHTTIKQGSGCLNCGGIGVVGMEVL